MRLNVGQFQLFIVIDCKDYNRKVNVNDVEAVIGLCHDVGANQGAIVTARGFTGGAVRRAKASGMNLYTLIDAEKHEWQTLVTVPMVVEVRGLESVQFTFSSNSAGDFRISQKDVEHPFGAAIFSSDGSPQGTLAELLQNQWDEGKVPSEPGEHRRSGSPQTTPAFAPTEVYTGLTFMPASASGAPSTSIRFRSPKYRDSRTN